MPDSTASNYPPDVNLKEIGVIGNDDEDDEESEANIAFWEERRQNQS